MRQLISGITGKPPGVALGALRAQHEGEAEQWNWSESSAFCLILAKPYRRALSLIFKIAHTYRPRCRPSSQVIDDPRTMADTCCPSRCSATGRHGTRLKPVPSSSIAKRPLASCTLRR
jgi:hypothetical protein